MLHDPHPPLEDRPLAITHTIQRILAALAAGAGAAVPLVPAGARPWVVGGAIVAGAIAHQLSVSSEVKGDDIQ